MAFEFAVNELHFSDGSVITLSAHDIVVLVGPNNAGKSAALREIVTLVDSPNLSDPNCKVLKGLGFQITKDKAALEAFLAELEPVPTQAEQFGRMGATARLDQVLPHAENPLALRRHLRAFCMYRVHREQAPRNRAGNLNQFRHAIEVPPVSLSIRRCRT
jgi:ABC-type branched-subunit amino acid transport system ATPase component